VSVPQCRFKDLLELFDDFDASILKHISIQMLFRDDGVSSFENSPNLQEKSTPGKPRCEKD
jgi:hypothetical protein